MWCGSQRIILVGNVRLFGLNGQTIYNLKLLPLSLTKTKTTFKIQMLAASIWEFQLLQCGVVFCVHRYLASNLQSRWVTIIYIFYLGVGQFNEDPVSENFRILVPTKQKTVSSNQIFKFKQYELDSIFFNKFWTTVRF